MARGCVWNEDLASAHLGFKGRRIFFLVSKTPRMGLVCSLSVIPPSFSDWPKVFPQGVYLRYPRWLAALGICAFPVIPSSRLIFGLNFAFSIVKNIRFSYMSSCKYCRKASAFSLIKAVTSQLHNLQYLLKNKNIICHCSINYGFISLFAYSWIIKMT